MRSAHKTTTFESLFPASIVPRPNPSRVGFCSISDWKILEDNFNVEESIDVVYDTTHAYREGMYAISPTAVT